MEAAGITRTATDMRRIIHIRRTQQLKTKRFCLAAFWMDFALGMYMVAIPFLSMSLGAESRVLGYLGATRGLSYGLSCLVVGFLLLDRFRRLTLITVGCAATILMSWATGMSGQLWHLFAVAVFWGMAVSFFWPALFGWLGGDHESDSTLGSAVGAVNLSWSVGIMIGGFIGGILYGLGPWVPFVAAALPVALAYLILLFTPAEVSEKKEGDAAGETWSGSGAELAAAWLSCLSMACLGGMMMGVFPRLGKDIGIGASKFGLLVATAGMGRTVMFALGMWKSNIVRDWRFSGIVQLAAAGMVATLCRAESYWWIACVYVVLGISFASTYYRSLYASLEGAGSKGMRSSVHEAVLFAGILIGSVGGGEIAERWALRSPYVPIACLVVLFGIVQLVLVGAARRKG